MGWGGFAAGLAVGSRVGSDWADNYNEAKLKHDLGEAAAKAPTMTEQESGADALQHARDSFTPQEGGPQTFDEYLNANPDFARAALPQLSKQQAGYDVGGKFYGGRDEADAAVKRRQSQALADVYRANGDPEKALRLEASGQEFEARGLQLKGARRQDANEEFKAKLDDLVRNYKTMDTPAFLSKAATVANGIKDDGQGFVWGENPDGTFTVGQHDRNSRKIVGSQQFDGDRDKLIQTLIKYSGADKFEESRKEDKADKRYDKEFGLKERETAVKEGTLSEASRHNKAIEGIYSQRDANSGAPHHSWAPVGVDSDGTPVFMDSKQFDPSKPGVGFVRADGKPVQDLKSVYRKLTGEKPSASADPWETPVEVKTVDPKTGTEIKRTVPMKVADPEGYAKAKRVDAYAGVDFGGGRAAAAPSAPKDPYVTRRGLGFVAIDPASGRVEPVTEYERRTGNSWVELPIR